MYTHHAVINTKGGIQTTVGTRKKRFNIKMKNKFGDHLLGNLLCMTTGFI